MGEQRFKVGDWVRVKDNRGAPRDYNVGDVRQVTKIDDNIVRCGSAGMFDYRFEPWQPRVGERVRYTGKSEAYSEVELVGLEGVVTETCNRMAIVNWDKPIVNGVRTGGAKYIENLEPILSTDTASEQPAALKIEAGKFYKTRDGRKVGPMRDIGSGAGTDRWKGSLGDDYSFWLDDGVHWSGQVRPTDLIAEWIDEPVAGDGYDTWFRAKVQESLDNTSPTIPHAQVMQSINSRIDAEIKPSNDNAQPKFKVGDRVNCLKSYPGQFTAGKEYVVSADHFGRKGESVKVKFDDSGSTSNGWLPEFFELSQPTTTIVALIENGQPKPSSTPHVHASTGAAEKEAKRLAAKYKGQQFGVFTLTTTHHEPKPVYDHKWQNMAVLGLKIDAIRELRSITGMGLKPAKDAVEYFLAAA